MNGRLLKSGLAAIALAALAGSLMAHDDDNDRDHGPRQGREIRGARESRRLSGSAGDIDGGVGRFRAIVDTKANTITWKLTYEGLEGAVSAVTRAFRPAEREWRCQFLPVFQPGERPRGHATLPLKDRRNSRGVITPDLVIGPSGTGIEAGAMAEIVAAIRNGTAYANVHSAKWPGGEIRGQLH
jgi:hypothetical protein